MYYTVEIISIQIFILEGIFMSNINESVRNILDRNGEVLKTLIIDNITIEKAENGQSELSLNTTNDMLNVHNMVHGGVLFSLADKTYGNR